jgi:hypothetical protein
MMILFALWTALCGLLLAVKLLGHESADIPHLIRHAADYGLLYAIGVVGGSALVITGRFLNRPRPIERFLVAPDGRGERGLRVGGIRLTPERVYGPLRRSVAWSDVDSVHLERVNLIPFLAVLGTKRGWRRDGFMQPLLPGTDHRVVRLVAYYVEHPSERELIGTREEAVRAASMGLLNATLHGE